MSEQRVNRRESLAFKFFLVCQQAVQRRCSSLRSARRSRKRRPPKRRPAPSASRPRHSWTSPAAAARSASLRPSRQPRSSRRAHRARRPQRWWTFPARAAASARAMPCRSPSCTGTWRRLPTSWVRPLVRETLVSLPVLKNSRNVGRQALLTPNVEYAILPLASERCKGMPCAHLSPAPYGCLSVVHGTW